MIKWLQRHATAHVSVHGVRGVTKRSESYKCDISGQKSAWGDHFPLVALLKEEHGINACAKAQGATTPLWLH